jgi:hypothetical protein
MKEKTLKLINNKLVLLEKAVEEKNKLKLLKFIIASLELVLVIL